MDAPSLAEALFGGGRRGSDELWQDREVRFDLPAAQLRCRRGEEVLEVFDSVEDTKGNNGQGGRLTLTSLRLTWVCARTPRTNISVGLSNVTSADVRPASSRLRGYCESLYVLTRHDQQRCEFIFTPLEEREPGLPEVLQALLAAYEASRPCRELRLRGAVLSHGELRLLPREAAFSRIAGVANLAGEPGSSVGTLYVTSVRMAWHSNSAASFNVSIPYLQVKAVRVADSRQGPALVVETTTAAGGHVLGFRVEPRETLDYVAKEVGSLLQAYVSCPIYGVDYTPGACGTAAPQPAPLMEQEEDEVCDSGAGAGIDAWAAYYADEGGGSGGSGGSGEPVFSAELGLAVEAPKDSASMRQLWSVL